MARMIRVETFLGSSMKAKQLRGDHERREKRNLRRCRAKLEDEIARTANGFACAVADGDDRPAEFLHFKQRFTFWLVAALAQKKREAGFRSDDGLGPMTKLESVVRLAIRAG